MYELIAIITKIVLGFASVAGILILWALLYALPIMWLWNYVIPYLFHGIPELDVWRAWALGTLCGMLFKSSSASASGSGK